MRSIRYILGSLCALLVTAWPMAAASQEGDTSQLSMKDKDFYFVYIDHEPETDETALIEKLDELHRSALDYGNVMIVYLANGDEPFISFTNMKDYMPDKQRDTDEAYQIICAELQSRTFHEPSREDFNVVRGIVGPAGVLPLFDETNADDPMLYQTIKFMFFVGLDFWNYGLNEYIIAKLYIELNLSTYMALYRSSQLGYEMWRSKDRPLPFETVGSPRFGTHNRGGINDNQKIRFHSYPD